MSVPAVTVTVCTMFQFWPVKSRVVSSTSRSLPEWPLILIRTFPVGWVARDTSYSPVSPSRTEISARETRIPRVSLSRIVTDGAGEFIMSPDALPLTRTVSSLSSTSSSTGFNWKSAVPIIWPASILSVKSSTGSKSFAEAVPGPTETVTSVSDVRGALLRVAVTVTAIPELPTPSETPVGFTASVNWFDAVSSSSIVTVTSSTVTPLYPPPFAVWVSVTGGSSSASTSCTTVTRTSCQSL